MSKSSVAKAIAAVLANPDDTAARLVCADAMMEAGDVRGELIQAQCRLEEMGAVPDWVGEHEGLAFPGVALDPDRERLRRRVQELLSAHEAQWSSAVRPLAACVDDGPRWWFSRGFLDHVALDLETFCERCSEVRQVTPLVGARIVKAAHLDHLERKDAERLGDAAALADLRHLEVELDGDGPSFAKLFSSKHARRLRSIVVEQPGREALEAIVALPELAELELKRVAQGAGQALADCERRLRALVAQTVGAPNVAALFARGALDEIERLDLCSNALDGKTLSSMLSRAGAKMTSLRLAHNGFATTGFKAIAAANLPKLTWLDASANKGTAAAMPALGAARGLPAVRVLFLDENGIGPEAAAALLAADGLPSLAALSLVQTRLGSKGAQALAQTKAASRLLALDLSRNQLGEEGAAALAGSKHLGNLRFLGLRTAGLKGDKVRPLARAEGLELQTLVISHNHLGAKGVKALLDGPGLRGLKNLDLDYNFLGPDSAKSVANAAHLDGLEEINLGWAGIGNRGLSHLAKSPHMSALKRFRLVNNELDDDAVRMLVDTWGDGIEVLELGGNTAIGDAGALLLAESAKLRNIRRIELGFSAVTAKGISALRARFGSRVGFWGVHAALTVP